jgi:hypothetical protein
MRAAAPNVIADLYEAAFDPSGLGQIPHVVRSAMGVDSAS